MQCIYNISEQKIILRGAEKKRGGIEKIAGTYQKAEGVSVKLIGAGGDDLETRKIDC